MPPRIKPENCTFGRVVNNIEGVKCVPLELFILKAAS